MHVQITISGEGSASGVTSTSGLPGAGNDSGALHVTTTSGAAGTGPGGDAISAGAAPSALAFGSTDGLGSGGHQGASDQSAGPAPQF